MRWRWVVLAVLGVLTGTALAALPGIAAQGGNLSGILSTSGPTIQVQVDAIRRFGLPLLTRIAVVQRDPKGLSTQAITRALARAAVVDRKTLENGADPDRELFAAYPLINTPSLVPGAAERNTTIVTYLFTDPSANIFAQQAAAYRYAADIDQPGDGLVGVAGAVPAQIEQGSVIGAALPTVETVTLMIIAVVVSVNFRSIAAPLITLGTAATGYLLADRALAGTSGLLNIPAAVELEPIVVALILGITTDYSIFFLAGLQGRLRAGERNPGATVAAVREYLPIVTTAGLTVACGVAGLVVARTGLFRELGPGLAVAVLVGLIVAITAVPRCSRSWVGGRSGPAATPRPPTTLRRRRRKAPTPKRTRLSRTRRHPVRAYSREARTGSRRRRVGRPCGPGRSAESRAAAAPPPSSPSS